MGYIKYSTLTFADVYPSSADFKTALDDFMALTSEPYGYTEAGVTTLYYLLYARYGNSPIANDDVNQFQYKVNTIVWTYYGIWKRKVEVQDEIMNLEETDLRAGAKQIYNHAYNPSNDNLTTGDTEEVPYINDQNTANYKKSKLDAYANLWQMLNANATEEFIRRFKPLFKTFVSPEHPILYYDVEEEE